MTVIKYSLYKRKSLETWHVFTDRVTWKLFKMSYVLSPAITYILISSDNITGSAEIFQTQESMQSISDTHMTFKD